MRPYQRIRHLGELARGGRCFIDAGIRSPGFGDDPLKATIPVAPGIGKPTASEVAFPGIGRPSSDFEAVRDGRRSTLLGYPIDLSSARSIAAGTALILPITGNVITSDPLYDLSGNAQAGIARVHFQDVNLNPVGTYVTMLPNSIYHVPFTQVLVENFAQPGKFIYLVYGVDVDLLPGNSQQVQILGDVSVKTAVRYNNAAVDAGNAFIGYADIAGANFTHAQIKNPSGSVKTVYVDRILSNAEAAAAYPQELWTFDTDLTTLVGTGTNKLLGGAAGVAQLRTQNNAAALGTTRIARRLSTDLKLDPFDFRDNPLRLDAGKGVLVVNGVAAHTMMANFEFREY